MLDQLTTSALAEESLGKETIVAGLCGVCPAGCGVNIHLQDGKIERLTPRHDHPQGIVCPRGLCAKEIVYSPDRLLYPLRRRGERGSGDYERISWDDAYEIWVTHLRRLAARYGPQSVALYTGRGNFEYGLNEMFAPSGTVESSANAVLFPFGSPNATGVGSLCYVSYGMLAPRSLFGVYLRDISEDLDQADLILIWGENPTTDSSPINLRRVKTAQRKGARVIVIDHRRSETVSATRAEWIGVRPGTDGALALGAIHVLIAEELFDNEFVTNWTHGFEALREYVKDFTPERVEQITWVPAEKVRELARAIGRAHGCAIMTYTGLEYSNTGVQALRAVWTLQALAGHMDVPGGKLFKSPRRVKISRNLTAPPANGPLPLGAREYPLYHDVRNEAHGIMLPSAILDDHPYPVRGLIISGSSLITSWPQPDLWRRALQALDYLVVINRFPTADAAYADLILPATTMFEIESFMQYDQRVVWRQKVIEPLGEARNDYLIFAELARRLGYGERWPQSEAEMIAFALQGTGFRYQDLCQAADGLRLPEPERSYRQYARGELRADGQPGFETPTGKFEIASEWFRQYGYEALPVYTEPMEGPLSAPEIAAQYPLVFNSGARTQSAFRSQHHNIQTLADRHPAPQVTLHPRDAAGRDIREGDPVWVISPRGKVPFVAHVSEDIVPGVIEANMGGGGPLGPVAWQEGNVNELTDFQNRDPISGFPVYKALLCEVTRRQPEGGM